MIKLLCLFFLSPCILYAHDPSPHDRKLWKTSLLTLAVANAFDVHSSWGKTELNPVLNSPGLRFGGQGTAIKLSLQGGLAGVEYMLTRGHRNGKVYRVMSILNFGASATIGGVAAHNYRIR